MGIELPEIKKYAGMFSHGLIIKIAPEIAKGILVEMFRAKKVTVKSASDWVQNNTSLWKSFEPGEQAMMKNLAEKVGNIDWLDAPWVIEAVKGDFPAVASLFLGWKKANNWLKRQVEIIRKEVVV
ncbi:hypothetical protein LCGC14_0541100 [marine sediment metagenome]|uniref:Uncharacterized protein n=1 Tax=marine sediment metagenome TaxID=412755 RepID=A0A0F9UE28_9ZZZZ